jgi:hypothetical protein
MDEYGDLGHSVGVVIHCGGGHLDIPGYAGTFTRAHDRDGKLIKEWKGDGDHFANFIKAVRSRKREDLHADILEGHLSSGLCHLGNISHRLGQEADPEQLREAVKSDHEAQEALARVEEHLAANGVNLTQTRLTVGPTLRLDPATEKFLGNPAADQLLTRPYRPGFVVPEQV